MTPADPDWDHDPILAEYIALFAPRTDLYVANGAAVVREDLTPDVVRAAIEHHYPVSAYLGTANGRTHVGAIDFDTTDGHTSALQIQTFLDSHAIPSLVAESHRGAHLWITSWDSVEAGTMHRLLRAAVALVLGEEADDDPKVEKFPKAGSDLAYGALRLPGLPHQKDQRVYPLHFSGPPAVGFSNPTFGQILANHQLTTPEAIRRLAGPAKLKSKYPKNLGGFYGYRPRERDWGDAPKASEVLRSWGVECRPGGTVKCPKHDDKHGSLTVFRDDQRVYCGASHCPLNNGGHGVGSVLLARMPAPG